MKHYISLGPSCFSAWNLKFLKLRTQSLPFDWLLTDEKKGIYYVNDLINTKFLNFTKNIKYNENNQVISKNYPYSKFIHHNLITNKVKNRPKDNGKNLVELMNKRGERFLNLINDDANEIIFLYMISYSLYNNDDEFQKFLNDLKEFESNKNIKCNYKLLVYIINDNDFELKILKEFKNIIFDKHIIDTKNIHSYNKSNLSKFKELLNRNNLI